MRMGLKDRCARRNHRQSLLSQFRQTNGDLHLTAQTTQDGSAILSIRRPTSHHDEVIYILRETEGRADKIDLKVIPQAVA